MAGLTFKHVLDAVTTGAAAFRCRRTLQPGGGAGTKVFPPTYTGAVYAVEQRRLPGREQPVTCVLLDSVQSQANRMEEALQQAIDAGQLKLPVIEVDFGAADLIEKVGKITSLQAPHRIADAILRDSEMSDGVPFRAGKNGKQSDIGTELDAASASNATPLFKHCPTGLVFGLWDSNGFRKRDRGVKIERAIVSEVVALNAAFGIRTSSRLDPLEIRRNSAVIYRTASGGWTLDPQTAMQQDGKPVLFAQNSKGADVTHDPKSDKLPDQGKPSVVNHGNVTPSFGKYARGAEGLDVMQPSSPRVKEGEIAPGGVTFESAEQTITLSLIALRRLRFPVNGTTSAEVDNAARAVLAALGLCAATLSADKGLDLRSRCLLWPDGPMQWELLAKPGETPQMFTLNSDNAITLLNDAVAHAAKLGMTWHDKRITLKPSKSLVDLVRRSQEQAVKGEAEESEAHDSKGK
jgi:CRISPR-associated protein Csb1